MNLSSLKRPNTPYSRKRMGRGAGSGKGTTGGRGTKGQRARTGGKGGLKLMGLKNTIMKLPKMGGFNSRHPKMQVVNLQQVNAIFKESEEVTPRNLEKYGLIENPAWKVKLLGQGALTKKLNFRVHAASASAKAAVEKAGGKLNIIPVKSRITQKPRPEAK